MSATLGGDPAHATYDHVRTGRTGHAEAIEVEFDPGTVTYREILELFFQIHDPTTQDRQGNDRGPQYRSVIFWTNEDQMQMAIDTVADVEASGLWPGRVVADVTAAGIFTEAEAAHQDYLQRNPDGYTCHFPRPDWRLPKRRAA